MANAVDHDPGRVCSVEDNATVRSYHEAAKIALVDGASAVWMVSE
jgi:hypothetical protein